jgi:hypothetical protein
MVSAGGLLQRDPRGNPRGTRICDYSISGAMAASTDCPFRLAMLLEGCASRSFEAASTLVPSSAFVVWRKQNT